MDSDEAAVQADQHLSAIATFRKGVQAMFAPILSKSKATVDAAKESHKQNQATEAALLKPAEDADAILREKLLARIKEQKAEAERKRLAEQADNASKAVDAQVAKAAKLEDIARVTGDEHYRKAAEQVLAQPVRPAASAAPAKPAPIKNAIVEHVAITVDDKVRLIVAVAEACVERLRRDGASEDQVAALRAGRAPVNAVQPDEKWLRKQAVQDGAAFDIPGVSRHVTDGLNVRAR